MLGTGSRRPRRRVLLPRGRAAARNTWPPKFFFLKKTRRLLRRASASSARHAGQGTTGATRTHPSTHPARPNTASNTTPPQGLLALVGATATVVFSYLFPGLIVLWSKPTAPQRAGASALLALGACMTATAIYDHLTGRSLE